MAGAEINFVCPIDEIGDENGYCTWVVTCYSGDKINIKVPANEIHVYCLERGSEIRKTSVYGIVNDFNKNCSTKCGEADPTPIEGYSYYEYENCNAASQKQIFRAPSSFTAWPSNLAYQSICWTNGGSTTNISYLDIANIPTYADCATCNAAIAPPPSPSPTPTPSPGTGQYCLSFTNSLTVISSTATIGEFENVTIRYYVMLDS